MNWTFRSIPLPKSNLQEFIGEYRDLLAEGIQKWLNDFKPEVDKQPEEYLAEFPEGFYRDEKAQPVAYRYEFSVGFYKNGKYYRIGQVPYNIAIERATPASYAHEEGVEKSNATRFRYIDNAPPII